MTRLKGMAGNSKIVFTVCVNDGQLTLSIPITAIEDEHDFDTWVADNADDVNDVIRIAMNHEKIVAYETAAAIKSI